MTLTSAVRKGAGRGAISGNAGILPSVPVGRSVEEEEASLPSPRPSQVGECIVEKKSSKRCTTSAKHLSACRRRGLLLRHTRGFGSFGRPPVTKKADPVRMDGGRGAVYGSPKVFLMNAAISPRVTVFCGQ
jgi:hypothetical protein